ncbi:MAG TPA: GAF domain-containing protein [Chryseosolibacter sp.]
MRSAFIGLGVFLVVLALTQTVTYQRYRILKDAENQRAIQEATLLRDRLKSSLSYSLSATKTLAFIVDRYGVPQDFDSIAQYILESNRFIDALELTRLGTITHVYPLQGNESVIGYDVLRDKRTEKEAFKAIERKSLFFAGPFELKQGGIGVVGRLPIYKNGSFWGFSVVLIKLNTLLSAAGIDKNLPEFEFQLSKANPQTGEEEFFLAKTFEPNASQVVSVDVPDGEWKLYVNPRTQAGSVKHVLSMAIIGLILSLTAGWFAFYSARQPEKLNRLVKVKTSQNATLNRLYRFTSAINKMMVKLKTDDEVFHEACKIAVETGEFKMAWVGLIDAKENVLKASAVAGNEHGYLAQVVPIDLSPKEFEVPIVKIIRTQQLVACNNIETDDIMKPWAAQALERGFKSCVLLPVKKFGNVIGSFNLYSDETNVFDDAELLLLREVTDDISFTLENIERETLFMNAVRQVENEKILSDSIINSLPGVFYLYDRNGKFLRWNDNFEQVSGYNADEIRTMHPTDFFDGDEKALLSERINEVFEKGYSEVRAQFFTRNKEHLTYYFNGRKVSFNGVEYLIGMGIDISEQAEAEKRLTEQTDEIRKLTEYLQHIREEERTNISREIHDVLGQQLTGLKMDSSWLRKHFDSDVEAKNRISEMICLIDDTIKTVRRISMQLRPGILDDLGLIAALDWQASDFEKRTGIKTTFTSNVTDLELPDKLATNIFRIFQEALTNVARHANATTVTTQLAVSAATIDLTIRDNGVGIDLAGIRQTNSLGIVGMKERARMFNGQLHFQQDLAGGTIVHLNVPMINHTPASYEISDIR